ncbi:unnamed protein product [Protopolystoma xenopodis]|uniref:Uncharacterized protein n=1 Tax=Protopolystoma xenopodis TaxID=117903 RepID=A0A448WWD8_9PLAT|nr:unnamed protein product [Protopolystoma xenopodis]
METSLDLLDYILSSVPQGPLLNHYGSLDGTGGGFGTASTPSDGSFSAESFTGVALRNSSLSSMSGNGQMDNESSGSPQSLLAPGHSEDGLNRTLSTPADPVSRATGPAKRSAQSGSETGLASGDVSDDKDTHNLREQISDLIRMEFEAPALTRTQAFQRRHASG